ncbi:ABC transporter permease [Streptomyces boninensis]|uniref:ABC transporter permease n=1 Tax=Streptomyces boninensis TaxID=2039455 RepID=UPI003B217465
MRRLPPAPLAVPALLAVAFLALPLAGILARVSWADLPSRLTDPDVTQALGLSLLVSGWALVLSLVLGVPLAWLLARADFRGKAAVRVLVMLPMVLPPTVAGVALLQGYGRRGVLGGLLESVFGVTLPFSTTGAVVAAAFVSMPFLVISLEGALNGLHVRYEETAASLGASPLRVFATITMPMVAPGLIAGAALCWARALGEFGATITFAGNLPGVTQTLPLKVYLLLQDDPEGATALSLLLLAIAALVLVALRGRWLPAGGDSAVPTHPPVADSDREEGVAGLPRPAALTRGQGGATPPKKPSTENKPTTTFFRWCRGTLAPAPAPGSAEPTPAPPAPLRTTVTGATTADLDLPPATTVAIVGPNGAGKTTLLRALLGLTPRARADHLTLGDLDAAALPPHRRRISWVPQDGALFPHLTALANTAYGLRTQGVPKAEARHEAQTWLDRLGVGHLAQRKPGALSGGQAQRVALARALAARPRLLLLDEPLAALDQTTRAHVRHTLRTHLRDFPGVCLIVTHDPVEAVSLADQVLVLEDGRTIQQAPPTELTRHPRSPWVARMLGRNAWPGTVAGNGDGTDTGTALAITGTGTETGGTIITADQNQPAAGEGTPALAVAAPEAVSLHRHRPTDASPRNVWPGTVRELTTQGSRLRVLISGSPDVVAEVTPAAAAELGLAEGAEIWVSIKATEISLIPL